MNILLYVVLKLQFKIEVMKSFIQIIFYKITNICVNLILLILRKVNFAISLFIYVDSLKLHDLMQRFTNF